MSLKTYLAVFETLGNEKRLEIYEFIRDNYFVSKSELASEMGLNRASLNHHLKSLETAQLVKEIDLLIEGRKQYFVYILKVVKLIDLVEDVLDSVKVTTIFEKIENKPIMFDSWSEIRNSFSSIDNKFVDAIETRLFKHVSKIGSNCSVCNNRPSISTCKSCFASMCKHCQHSIKTDDGIINLCQKCIRQYFG